MHADRAASKTIYRRMSGANNQRRKNTPQCNKKAVERDMKRFAEERSEEGLDLFEHELETKQSLAHLIQNRKASKEQRIAHKNTILAAKSHEKPLIKPVLSFRARKQILRLCNAERAHWLPASYSSAGQHHESDVEAIASPLLECFPLSAELFRSSQTAFTVLRSAVQPRFYEFRAIFRFERALLRNLNELAACLEDNLAAAADGGDGGGGGDDAIKSVSVPRGFEWLFEEGSASHLPSPLLLLRHLDGNTELRHLDLTPHHFVNSLEALSRSSSAAEIGPFTRIAALHLPNFESRAQRVERERRHCEREWCEMREEFQRVIRRLQTALDRLCNQRDALI